MSNRNTIGARAFRQMLTKIVEGAAALPAEDWMYLADEVSLAVMEEDRRTMFSVIGPVTLKGWAELHRQVDNYAAAKPFPFVVIDLRRSTLPDCSVAELLRASAGPQSPCRLAMIVPEDWYWPAFDWCLARARVSMDAACAVFYEIESVQSWHEAWVGWNARQVRGGVPLN